MLAVVLALSLFAPPLRVESATAQVDPVATRSGLRVRLGARADGWTVHVSTIDDNGAADLSLMAPDGATFERRVALTGDNVEDRSRELAATLALIIEGYTVRTPDPEPPPDPPPPQPPLIPTGWLAVGGRVGLGSPAQIDPDFGVGLRGGAWLVSDHIQPVAAASWSRSVAGGLALDGIRFGLGAFFGGSVAQRRLWLGAGGLGRAMWVQAADRERITTWTSSTELAALAQYRTRWVLAGLRLGAELTLPPLGASGRDSQLRWGPVRFLVGVEFGILWSRRARDGRTGVVGYATDPRGTRMRARRRRDAGGGSAR